LAPLHASAGNAPEEVDGGEADKSEQGGTSLRKIVCGSCILELCFGRDLWLGSWVTYTSSFLSRKLCC
jgi:hypothetical protein